MFFQTSYKKPAFRLWWLLVKSQIEKKITTKFIYVFYKYDKYKLFFSFFKY